MYHGLNTFCLYCILQTIGTARECLTFSGSKFTCNYLKAGGNKWLCNCGELQAYLPPSFFTQMRNFQLTSVTIQGKHYRHYSCVIFATHSMYSKWQQLLLMNICSPHMLKAKTFKGHELPTRLPVTCKDEFCWARHRNWHLNKQVKLITFQLLRKKCRAEDVNTTADDQHAVLQATESLKQDLMAKLEEKAIAQSAELRNQVTQIWMELRSAVLIKESRQPSIWSELEFEINSHSDLCGIRCQRQEKRTGHTDRPMRRFRSKKWRKDVSM